MRCVDVNVLVDAHRPEATAHEAVRRWLDDARADAEPLGLPSVVASGFLRIVTHPRIFREPTPVPTALAFVEELRRSPAVTPVEPGERHWPIFVQLCDSLGLRGNDVPDAYLAAMAIELGATWVTSDRGFVGIPGVRVEHPAAVS
jgi:toxin-antitoxin system PIN domain toxin